MDDKNRVQDNGLIRLQVVLLNMIKKKIFVKIGVVNSVENVSEFQ